MAKHNTHNMEKRNVETTVSPKMGKKTKLYWMSILVGIALIAVALVVKNKDNADIAGTDEDDTLERVELMDEEMEDIMKWDESSLSEGNSLEGVLHKSEDSSRGNFKLISKLGDIYLRTSRDFSSLVGLQVLVLISGTQDNFELLDIQPRVENDGFIQAQ